MRTGMSVSKLSFFFKFRKSAENQEMSAKCNISKPFALLLSLDSEFLNNF